LLSSAPELLNRVSTLTERVTELLSDRNQDTISDILDNTERTTRAFADRSPEIAATLAEARIAIRQAGDAAARFGRVADSTDRLLNREGDAVVRDLRATIRSAQSTVETLDATIGEARPGVQALTKQTIPEVGQLVRDLRETTDALRSITTRVDREGATSLLGAPKLPDYEPGKTK
jgi:phospholipid/cholesterol/gamma-HCH transport system substrate-binding protein